MSWKTPNTEEALGLTLCCCVSGSALAARSDQSNQSERRTEVWPDLAKDMSRAERMPDEIMAVLWEAGWRVCALPQSSGIPVPTSGGRRAETRCRRARLA